MCHFFFFPKIKYVLKETHFSDIDSIKIVAMTELKKIPENVFQECFELWKRQMHKCFQVEEDYFEGILLWRILIFFNKSFYNTSLVTFWTHLIYCPDILYFLTPTIKFYAEKLLVNTLTTFRVSRQ